MALTKGIPITNAAPTPLAGRQADMATVVANADGSPRVGVLGYPGNLLTPLGTMNVRIAAAEFVVSKSKADGVVFMTNDGNLDVAISAAPGSNSRIDVIWVRHQDNTTGDGASTPLAGVTAGTAAASPTKPSIPTGALELGTIRVYAGTVAANGGSNVTTNTFAMTAMRGGVVPFRTKAELDAWTTAQEGQLARVNADGTAINNALYERESSSWNSFATDPMPLQIDGSNSAPRAIIQHGRGKITGNNTYQILEGVVFPTPFAAGTMPTVTIVPTGYRSAGAFSDGPTTASINWASAVSKSNTGFTAILTIETGFTLASSLDYYYDWIAVGVV